MDYKNGKWARQIIELQHEDGSWGYFHTLSQPTKEQPMTTEQALRRLRILGFTAEDEPIRRALAYTEKCLTGELSIPDYSEVKPDWLLFLNTVFASIIRLFMPEHKLTVKVVAHWAEVIEKAFSKGMFVQALYDEGYRTALHPQGKKIDYFKSFVNFYPLVLLPNTLSPETERRMFDYVLNYPNGIYYIGYSRSIIDFPPVFASLETSRYLSMLELLSQFGAAREKLAFTVDWLNRNKDKNGQWDLGPKANDGVYFPLSDSWRKIEDRKADCTNRIAALLDKLNPLKHN